MEIKIRFLDIPKDNEMGGGAVLLLRENHYKEKQ